MTGKVVLGKCKVFLNTISSRLPTNSSKERCKAYRNVPHTRNPLVMANIAQIDADIAEDSAMVGKLYVYNHFDTRKEDDLSFSSKAMLLHRSHRCPFFVAIREPPPP